MIKKNLIQKLILTTVLLISSNAYAYVGEILEVVDSKYSIKESNTPSCTLLKHRLSDYENKFREYRKLLHKNEYNEKINTKEYLYKNLMFNFDYESEDFIQVNYVLKTNPRMREQINSHGIERLFISINGDGLKMSQEVSAHRESFSTFIGYEEATNKLLITFSVPLLEYCFNLDRQALVSWLPIDNTDKVNLIKQANGPQKNEFILEKQKEYSALLDKASNIKLKYRKMAIEYYNDFNKSLGYEIDKVLQKCLSTLTKDECNDRNDLIATIRPALILKSAQRLTQSLSSEEQVELFTFIKEFYTNKLTFKFNNDRKTFEWSFDNKHHHNALMHSNQTTFEELISFLNSVLKQLTSIEPFINTKELEEAIAITQLILKSIIDKKGTER